MATRTEVEKWRKHILLPYKVFFKFWTYTLPKVSSIIRQMKAYIILYSPMVSWEKEKEIIKKEYFENIHKALKTVILLFYFDHSFTFFLLKKHFYSKKFILVSRITFLCILDKKKLIQNIISTRIGWEN